MDNFKCEKIYNAILEKKDRVVVVEIYMQITIRQLIF